MTAPDIQARLFTHVRCRDMEKRWHEAAMYLIETGDHEAAMETIVEFERWRDRGDAAECQPYLESYWDEI